MFFNKKRNYHGTIHDGAVGIRETMHEKPVCRPWFSKTSQESCKWLRFSKQNNRVLIS